MQTTNVYSVTATQLSRHCLAIYNSPQMDGQREKAQSLYPLEYSLIRLHFLGMVRVTEEAHARLSHFLRYLESTVS